jgi:hypothetical protein
LIYYDPPTLKDAVVLAELYGLSDAHEDLLWTVRAVCAANGPTPPVCYSGFKNRMDGCGFSLNFLVLVHDLGCFEVEPVPDEEIDFLGMDNEAGDEVFVHTFKYIGGEEGG